MSDILGLVSFKTTTKQQTTTEWAGPCPWCGGDDRFRVWTDRQRYWCRGCGKSGDGIQFCRDALGMGFDQAQRFVATAPSPPPRHDQKTFSPQKSKATRQQIPDRKWQNRLGGVIEEATDCLWSGKDNTGLEYLRGRALTDDTIQDHHLGYNPVGFNQGGIWIPEGFVIPWYLRGKLVAVNVRRLDAPGAFPKYHKVKGSRNSIYRGSLLGKSPDLPVIVVEGEFDAVSVWQAANDLVLPVATGSATGGRVKPLVKKMLQHELVLLSFDRDDAGRKAVRWWRENLPQAILWRPPRDADCNSLLQNDRLRDWLLRGLGK